MRLLSLPSTEDPQAQALTNDLQHLTNDTRAFYNSIKKRIMALAQGNANLRALIAAGQSMYDLTPQDVDVRQTQVDALKERFKAAIQRYAEVEQEHRAKNRVRMERQVKTVYPNLSAQEITDVVKKAETNGGENLFSQAVSGLEWPILGIALTRVDSTGFARSSHVRSSWSVARGRVSSC